jgi:DNA-binding transcriptional MerR regulator
LSQHTLRDYERAGMLDPVGHQISSRHRRYSDADVSRMSTLGLLFHAAEHTIRHGGQIITLAHVVQGAA